MQALKYLKDKEMEKVQMELLEINRRIREQVWICPMAWIWLSDITVQFLFVYT